MSTAIVAEGLVREFKGGVRAVDGVDLSVETGEVYGFLGPNGAGKSTTVRMLATLLRPTSGRATVGGLDVVVDAAAIRRRIGIALQEAAIDPWMTGRELLRLQAVLHGFSAARGRARAEALLEQVDITAAADRRVGTYSGGMRRRLDLALSLVHEPEILFLDEPTTGLDPLSRTTVWDEVRRLNREQGATIFLTTQYLEEADQLADRLGIINEGRIVATGTPTELKATIGSPTLAVGLANAGQERAAHEILATFGPAAHDDSGAQTVRLDGGADRVADVIRQLDVAGIAITALDLRQPSLDDVFLATTRNGGPDDADGLPPR